MKSSHMCHVEFRRVSLHSFRLWKTSTKSRRHDCGHGLPEGKFSEDFYFNEWIQRTYGQPSPSCQLCPLLPNRKSAKILKHLKNIPSGPKKSSSGLPYKSTRGSLTLGVCPGMRRSMIAYRPSRFISKTENESWGNEMHTSMYFSKHFLGLAPNLKITLSYMWVRKYGKDWRRQDCTLRTTFGYILILQWLCWCEIVGLVEPASEFSMSPGKPTKEGKTYSILWLIE